MKNRTAESPEPKAKKSKKDIPTKEIPVSPKTNELPSALPAKVDNVLMAEKVSWTSFGGLGTAETSLTGSRHLVKIIDKTGREVRILLDCGLWQGKGEERNGSFEIAPSGLHHVVLTHAHMDHAGQLPLLIKNGYEGNIYSTRITQESAMLGLKDSAKIGESKKESMKGLKKKLSEARSIVWSAQSNGIIRDSGNRNRLDGTGTLPESLGMGKGMKNRSRKIAEKAWKPGDPDRRSGKRNPSHGGSAIHDVSEEKLHNARKLLAEYGLYDLQKGCFTKTSIAKVTQLNAAGFYDKTDVADVGAYFKNFEYNQSFELEPGIEAVFLNAGHIPGSSMIVLKIRLEDDENGKARFHHLLFSGDVGRIRGKFHPYGVPSIPLHIPLDTIVHETTYGWKIHLDRELATEELWHIIRDAKLKKKKAVIITTFAIERCASILHDIIRGKDMEYYDGEIVLDSPLGKLQMELSRAITIDPEFARNLRREGQAYKIFKEEGKKKWEEKPKGDPRVGFDKKKSFQIVITGAGMAGGGPVQSWLKLYSNNDQFEFVFTGYQVPGTIGARLAIEKKKSITIDGLKLEVRAKIHKIDGFSAHADAKDLFDLMEYGKRSRKYGERHRNAKEILVHGDQESSTLEFTHYLQRRAKEKKRGIPMPANIHMPKLEEEIVLVDLTAKRVKDILSLGSETDES